MTGRTRTSSVHACLFVFAPHGPVEYCMVRAPGGVIAPGANVYVQRPRSDAWVEAVVVPAWNHEFGSVVCLELQR